MTSLEYGLIATVIAIIGFCIFRLYRKNTKINTTVSDLSGTVDSRITALQEQLNIPVYLEDTIKNSYDRRNAYVKNALSEKERAEEEQTTAKKVLEDAQKALEDAQKVVVKKGESVECAEGKLNEFTKKYGNGNEPMCCSES